jgi:meso-butanediol dehydrogenase/(S,S)-butanediol dehydrogenase/diacetyl reductase
MSPRTVLMTGDANPKSIGAHIRDTMRGFGSKVISYSGDVRCVDHGFDYDRLPIGHDWDALIACHGVMDLNWFESASGKKVRQIFDVNLTGNYMLAQEFVRATIDSEHRKKIIFMGSMAYTKVLNASAAYCASKAGLAMLTRCLAWELAPKGYDVYCVHPSNVEDAPMSEETIQGLMRYRDLSLEQAVAYWRDSVIRDHQLTKEEISFTVSMLLRGEAGYMSGSNIELAGGAR